MLDAHFFVVEIVIPTTDIARGVHTLNAGIQSFIADNSVTQC